MASQIDGIRWNRKKISFSSVCNHKTNSFRPLSVAIFNSFECVTIMFILTCSLSNSFTHPPYIYGRTVRTTFIGEARKRTTFDFIRLKTFSLTAAVFCVNTKSWYLYTNRVQTTAELQIEKKSIFFF